MKRKKQAISFFILFCLCLLMAEQKEAKAAETVTKGAYTYFAEDGIIYKMHTSSGKISKVFKVKRSNTVEIFSVKGKWLYLTVDDYYSKRGTDLTWKYVCRVKINGKNLQTLAKGESPYISGNYIYYMAKDFNKKGSPYIKDKGIARMSLNGKKKKILNSSYSYYYWVKPYNGRIYFSGGTGSGDMDVCSMDPKGQNLKQHASGEGTPYFCKNMMYYNVTSTGRLGRIYTVYSENLEDGTTEYIADGELKTGYGNTLYYTASNGQKDILYRYNISKKKASKVCGRLMIRNVIGGKKWLIVQYYRGDSSKKNIGVDRIRLNGKNKKTITAYFRS
ncbi:MAG: hypothetical protein HFG97_11225 [Dorea sp.]|nr:hypothetical protein [Dorea sp.]